jgi:hypothetical protein
MTGGQTEIAAASRKENRRKLECSVRKKKKNS